MPATRHGSLLYKSSLGSLLHPQKLHPVLLRSWYLKYGTDAAGGRKESPHAGNLVRFMLWQNMWPHCHLQYTGRYVACGSAGRGSEINQNVGQSLPLCSRGAQSVGGRDPSSAERTTFSAGSLPSKLPESPKLRSFCGSKS